MNVFVRVDIFRLSMFMNVNFGEGGGWMYLCRWMCVYLKGTVVVLVCMREVVMEVASL